MKYDLERFKKFFKKGEQVCIGFRGGDTHGYISKFDEKGIYLIQLTHATEYFYPWNQFEVLVHAGVRIKNEKLDNFSKLLMINLMPEHELDEQALKYGRWDDKYLPENNNNAAQYLLNFKKEMFDYDESNENTLITMKNDFPGKYKLYTSVLFGKAVINPESTVFNSDHYKCVSDKVNHERPNSDAFVVDNCGNLCEAIKGYENTAELESNELHLRGNYYNATVTMNEIISACGVGEELGDIPVLVPYRMDITFPQVGCAREYVYSNKEEDIGKELLKALRAEKGGIKLKDVYVGDPYSCDDEQKMVDFKVWETGQGFIFANHHAEIFVN